MFKPENVKYRGMRREVSRILKKAIFDGAFEPGQQIYEAELARELKLSRGPVREALLQLEKESLVHSVFNRGWFVIELTPGQMSEILGLRAVLEVLTLELAKDNITARELGRLNRIQAEMLSAFDQKKYDEAIQGDFNFHQELWRIAAHPILQDTLIKITTPYFVFFKLAHIRKGMNLSAFNDSLTRHHAMVDFLAGKADWSAEFCIRRHFEPVRLLNWSFLLDTIHK